MEILPPEPGTDALARAPDALSPRAPVAELAKLAPEEAQHVKSFLERRYAVNTRRAYEHAWASWKGWCLRRGVSPLPAHPREIVLCIASTKWGLSKAEQVIAAIARTHRLSGIDPPPTEHTLVKDAMTVLRRDRGTAPKGAKEAITLEELRQLESQIDRATLRGKRDAAILLLTWWSACRRSEIAALEVSDITRAPGGLAITIRRSKGDQLGEGAIVGVEAKAELCPVAALAAWQEAGQIATGPLFRHLTRKGELTPQPVRGDEIAGIVKRRARAAGLDPARFAGHSLRAGHVTEAIRQGVSDVQIMATTRHKSVTMLLRYHRTADPVKRGSASKIKL